MPYKTSLKTRPLFINNSADYFSIILLKSYIRSIIEISFFWNVINNIGLKASYIGTSLPYIVLKDVILKLYNIVNQYVKQINSKLLIIKVMLILWIF